MILDIFFFSSSILLYSICHSLSKAFSLDLYHKLISLYLISLSSFFFSFSLLLNTILLLFPLFVSRFLNYYPSYLSTPLLCPNPKANRTRFLRLSSYPSWLPVPSSSRRWWPRYTYFKSSYANSHLVWTLSRVNTFQILSCLLTKINILLWLLLGRKFSENQILCFFFFFAPNDFPKKWKLKLIRKNQPNYKKIFPIASLFLKLNSFKVR